MSYNGDNNPSSQHGTDDVLILRKTKEQCQGYCKHCKVPGHGTKKCLLRKEVALKIQEAENVKRLLVPTVVDAPRKIAPVRDRSTFEWTQLWPAMCRKLTDLDKVDGTLRGSRDLEGPAPFTIRYGVPISIRNILGKNHIAPHDQEEQILDTFSDTYLLLERKAQLRLEIVPGKDDFWSILVEFGGSKASEDFASASRRSIIHAGGFRFPLLKTPQNICTVYIRNVKLDERLAAEIIRNELSSVRYRCLSVWAQYYPRKRSLQTRVDPDTQASTRTIEIKSFVNTMAAVVELFQPPGSDQSAFPQLVADTLPTCIRFDPDTVLALDHLGRQGYNSQAADHAKHENTGQERLAHTTETCSHCSTCPLQGRYSGESMLAEETPLLGVVS